MGKQLNTEQFIEKARKIHGDKYDYSKVEYKNTEIKVCIICSKHGEFYQSPHDHLAGKGCKLCAIEEIKQKRRFSTEQFIEKARKIHGDKYDYSKVEYVGNHKKVSIICKKCGKIFFQTPHNHLSGQDCPNCVNAGPSKPEKQIMEFLNNMGEKFIYQKRFSDCRNKKPLPFDFYLPNRDICIEYQGKQHFNKVDKFGGDNGFKIIKLTDKIKKEWCSIPNNPTLLEITYLDDINKVLTEHLIEKGRS